MILPASHWPLGYNCGCGVPFLAAVAFDVENGGLWWCRGCRRYLCGEGARCDLFYPPRTMYDGQTFHRRPHKGGAPFYGHLNPDGSIAIDIRGQARMSPPELAALADSLVHLHLKAKELEARLAGALRHQFVFAEGAYRVRYMRKEQALVAVKPRRASSCDACGKAIQPGATAYQHGGSGQGERFCAPCVEQARKPALRLVWNATQNQPGVDDGR